LTLCERRAHDAAVRVAGVALILVIVGLGAAAWRPAAVSACVGVTLDFEDALRLSDGAIYAGRITRAETAATFWIDLTIDIDRVVRGPAATRVSRAQAGDVCDGIQVGQYGYIVRGVLDPEYGPDKHDVFFRINRSDARAALIAAGLPDTSTTSEGKSPSAPATPWTWLALWLATTFVLASRGVHRHRRSDRVR
jgi:hypothetical protein